MTALAVTAPAACGHRRHCSYHCMGMNYLLYVRSNTWSGGSMGPDHAHHHAPLYNCLRIRNQQFGKSFEWMITTVEMGCSNEWTKSFSPDWMIELICHCCCCCCCLPPVSEDKALLLHHIILLLASEPGSCSAAGAISLS